MKFVSPELFLPFTQTVKPPVCPCKIKMVNNRALRLRGLLLCPPNFFAPSGLLQLGLKRIKWLATPLVIIRKCACLAPSWNASNALS